MSLLMVHRIPNKNKKETHENYTNQIITLGNQLPVLCHP